jgi:hypothetical protein
LIGTFSGLALVYSPDLIDRSKIAGVGTVTFVGRAEELRCRHADLVVVDLSRLGNLDVLASIVSPRIVGFASHVDRSLMADARAAGCTEVLARSAFFARLATVFAEPDWRPGARPEGETHEPAPRSEP